MPLPSRMKLFSATLAALVSGVLVSMGFPGFKFPTLSQGWLLPFALVPLFVAMELIESPPPGSAYARTKPESFFQRGGFLRVFFLTWIFGSTVAFIAFFWCTYPAILFGNLPPFVAYPAFGLYCLLSGTFMPLVFLPFTISAVRRRRKQKPFPILLMALASTFLEMTIPRFFYWTFGSLMHSLETVNQWSSVLGFSGASFFIFFSNGVLARVLVIEPRTALRTLRSFAGVALFWAAIVGYGSYRISAFDKILPDLPKSRVGFIQPNFTFSELSSNPVRPVDAQQMSLSTLLRMSKEVVELSPDVPLDLIVWPESVVPFTFASSKDQVSQVEAFAREHNVPVLVQATEIDPEELERVGYRNVTMYSASFLIRPDGSRSASFRKWVPIPFGEIVPGEQYIPALGELVRENIGNTSKVGIGTSYEGLAYTENFYVAPLICFDSIYPNLPRLQALKGNASIFVNQANFVWMDVSNAGAEFRELDRFRAVENARSMLLASNTGPSVAFDPLGRELFSSTSVMTQGKGVAILPIYSETTLYSRFGDAPLLSLGLASVVLLIYLSRKQR